MECMSIFTKKMGICTEEKYTQNQVTSIYLILYLMVFLFLFGGGYKLKVIAANIF